MDSSNLFISANPRAIDKQLKEEQKNDISIGKRFLLDYPKIH
jgi:hypothetical protein